MVVDGAHQKDAFAFGDLEVGALHDHRTGLDHEEAANQNQQKFCLAQHRKGGKRATEGERSGVTHENLGGRGVPPEEPDERADDCGGNNGEVKRVTNVVTLVGVKRVEACAVATLVELPKADHHEGADGQNGCAGREAIKTIGHIDAVRGGGDNEAGPQQVEDRADDRAGDHEVDR